MLRSISIPAASLAPQGVRTALFVRHLTTTSTQSPSEPQPDLAATASPDQQTQESPPAAAVQTTKPKASHGQYFISRSFAQNLPVYHTRKRGGNMKLTEVKKVQGDAIALSKDLSALLGLPPSEVNVNSLTKHVVIRVSGRIIGISR